MTLWSGQAQYVSSSRGREFAPPLVPAATQVPIKVLEVNTDAYAYGICIMAYGKYICIRRCPSRCSR